MSKVLLVSSGLKHTHEFVEPYIKRIYSYLNKKGSVVDLRDTASFDERTFFSYDQVIFVFMNALDSIPSSTLEIFERISKAETNHQEIYAMIVCDEYEPEKCDHSKKIIKKWCEKENLQFKGSFHLGAGLIIMQSLRKFTVTMMIEKFVNKIINHQDVKINLTVFSLNSFIKDGNRYWHNEMKKKRREINKMNQK